MKAEVLKSKKGAVMIIATIIILIFTLLGLSLLGLASGEIAQARKDINKIKAFYLAEAGIERLVADLQNRCFENIGQTELGDGNFYVNYGTVEGEPSAVSVGEVAGQTKRIQVTISFLAPAFECGVYAGNINGAAWSLILRGIGEPVVTGPHDEIGGKDKVNGNVFVKGDVDMYEESMVGPAPLPNLYNFEGDVEATGLVVCNDSASISGDVLENSDKQVSPDYLGLVGMNYAVNNTHNVTQIFEDAHIVGGKLPVGNELEDVFMINPPDRDVECATTPGNDYFLEPQSLDGGGTFREAKTPLDVGADRVYYIDGDLWVHTNSSYGFILEGKATIVVTGNIHISDNILYKDSNSMLGLVALGTYDDYGNLVSGGDIYFGDPRYGTMYVFSGMMFAARDFCFSTDSTSKKPTEPRTGFTVNGNLTALNNVSIERDWYTDASNVDRPASYDPSTGQWVDSSTGTVLTSEQIGTLRHYQMVINYDERVRNVNTRPHGLPSGLGMIFCGITNWKELE